MPSSNWGPLIDPETPPSIQDLYIGQPVDFVFAAQDPDSRRRKITSGVNIGINLLVVGFLAWSFLSDGLFIDQLGQPEFWEKIKGDYINLPDEDEKIAVMIASIIGVTIILAMIIGTVVGILKLFKTEKLWYIGTKDSLIIVKGKKTAP